MADGAPADHLRLRLAQADLAHVLEHTAGLWAELRGERVLLTGGTGFFGRWLVESFLHANSALGLEARLTVLSRKPAAFQQRQRTFVPTLRWSWLRVTFAPSSFLLGTLAL